MIAFDSRVRFEPSAESNGSFVRGGEIVIPIDASLPRESLPGWIVDGQQRSAAIEQQTAQGPDGNDGKRSEDRWHERRHALD